MEARRHKDRAIEVARERGIARGADFDQAGVPRVYLQRLTRDGTLQRVGRGLYKLSDAPSDVASSLAEASRIQPKGVIGLLSALQFHELTTQTPHAVWMLLGPKDWAPINPSVQIKVIRASVPSLRTGVKIHPIDGMSVPITTLQAPHVAVEALRDLSPGLSSHPSTISGDVPRWTACRP